MIELRWYECKQHCWRWRLLVIMTVVPVTLWPGRDRDLDCGQCWLGGQTAPTLAMAGTVPPSPPSRPHHHHHTHPEPVQNKNTFKQNLNINFFAFFSWKWKQQIGWFKTSISTQDCRMINPRKLKPSSLFRSSLMPALKSSTKPPSTSATKFNISVCMLCWLSGFKSTRTSSKSMETQNSVKLEHTKVHINVLRGQTKINKLLVLHSNLCKLDVH